MVETLFDPINVDSEGNIEFIDFKTVAKILLGQQEICPNFYGLENLVIRILAYYGISQGGDADRVNIPEYNRPDAFWIYLPHEAGTKIRLVINRNSKFDPKQIHPDVAEFYSHIPLSQQTSGDFYESNLIVYYSKKIAEEYNRSLPLFLILLNTMIAQYQERNYSALPVAAD